MPGQQRLADFINVLMGKPPQQAPPVQLPPGQPNRPLGQDKLSDVVEALFGALGVYDPLGQDASKATTLGGMLTAALPIIGSVRAAQAAKGASAERIATWVRPPEAILEGIPEMPLTIFEEDVYALDKYLYACKLIVDCQRAAASVSRSTWDDICQRMLIVPRRVNPKAR